MAEGLAKPRESLEFFRNNFAELEGFSIAMCPARLQHRDRPCCRSGRRVLDLDPWLGDSRRFLLADGNRSILGGF